MYWRLAVAAQSGFFSGIAAAENGVDHVFTSGQVRELLVYIAYVAFGERGHILVVLLALAAEFLSHYHHHCRISGCRDFRDIPSVSLSDCESDVASAGGQCCEHRHVFRIGELFVIVTGLVIHFADVDHLEVLQEVLPEDEENTIVFLGMAQCALIRWRYAVPELLVTV